MVASTGSRECGAGGFGQRAPRPRTGASRRGGRAAAGGGRFGRAREGITDPGRGPPSRCCLVRCLPRAASRARAAHPVALLATRGGLELSVTVAITAGNVRTSKRMNNETQTQVIWCCKRQRFLVSLLSL